MEVGGDSVVTVLNEAVVFWDFDVAPGQRFTYVWRRGARLRLTNPYLMVGGMHWDFEKKEGLVW